MKLYLLTYANLSAFIVRAKDENAARSLIKEKYGENKNDYDCTELNPSIEEQSILYWFSI